MSWHGFRPYVSAAERKAKAAKQVKNLQKKGRVIEPLGELTHRIKIATSFWGRSWCRHLESFSDYDSRLPRGRTYVRNGSVLHLAVEPGTVNALVQGSELYELEIRIDRLDAKRWRAIQERCRGKIGSLIELLQGTISAEIMTIVTDKHAGLFPSPKEIHLNCNCPDWATMCKHVAAVLYGIGAKLDTEPELLFKLRGVDHHELIAAGDASALGGKPRTSRRRTLDAASLENVFGIELDASDPAALVAETPVELRRRSKPQTTESPKPAVTPKKRATTKRKASPKKTPEPFDPTPEAIRDLRERLGMSRSTFARRLAVSVAMVARWERPERASSVPKNMQAKLARLNAN